MRKKIIDYDYAFKINFNANIYCDIALENYFLTKSTYEEIMKAKNTCGEYLDRLDYYQGKQIACTVFSQMCIEALLNDFASDYLTRKEIEDFFDKLDIQKKIKFIAKFILHKKIRTDGVLFNNIKIMTKNRNESIHNKSKIITNDEYIAMEEKLGEQELNNNDFREFFILAKQSISAIIETAKFLSNPSNDALIVEMLFIGQYDNNAQRELRNKAVKEFNIKLDPSI